MAVRFRPPAPNFKVMYLETIDTVIATDLHGQVLKFRELKVRYPGVLILINGDLVDGEDTRQLLDEVGESDNVKIGTGNHEIISRAVTQERDDDLRDIWQDRWRHNDSRYNKYEHKTLRSYGIDEKLPNRLAAEKLRDKMERLGHLAILNTASMYFETDEFIAIHGGLTEENWEDQKKKLDKDSIQMSLNNFCAPSQIMDHDFSLSTSTSTSVTDKILITGHAHFNPGVDRVTNEGKRVRLASKLALGAPLFVWQSWDKKVVSI
jgi:hypothetical protein